MGQIKPDEVTESVALQRVLDAAYVLLEIIDAHITALFTSTIIAGLVYMTQVRSARALQSEVKRFAVDIKQVMEGYTFMRARLFSYDAKSQFVKRGDFAAIGLMRQKERFETRFMALRDFRFN